MAIFNPSELANADPNDYQKSLGIFGIREVISDFADSMSDILDKNEAKNKNIVERARSEYSERMSVTLEDESIYNLVHLMRNSLFTVSITNALTDIVNPLADRLELFHLEDRLETIQQHKERQMQLQRVIDAVISTADTANQNFITSMMRQYRNFMSNPVLSTLHIFVNKVAMPLFNMTRSILFGSKKGLSDADRIVKSVNELKEFLMTGQVDNTKTFAERLISSGVIGLPVKMLSESIAGIAGISRENAQRREDALASGSTLSDQGLLRNPKGFISDLIFGDELVRKGKMGGIITGSESETGEPQEIAIFHSILDKIGELAEAEQRSYIELQTIGNLIRDPSGLKKIQDQNQKMMEISKANFKITTRGDGNVINLMKNEQGVFTDIRDILKQSADSNKEQADLGKKSLTIQKKMHRQGVMNMLVGTITRFATSITGVLGGIGVGVLGGGAMGLAGKLFSKSGIKKMASAAMKRAGALVGGPLGVGVMLGILAYELYDWLAPDSVKQVVNQAFSDIGDGIVDGWKYAVGKTTDLFEAIDMTFTSIQQHMIDVWNNTVGSVSEFFGNAKDSVVNAVDTVSDYVFGESPSPSVNFEQPRDQDPLGELMRRIAADPTRDLSDTVQHELTREMIEQLKDIKKGQNSSGGKSTRMINSSSVLSENPINMQDSVYGGN